MTGQEQGTVVATTANCEVVLDSRGFYVRCTSSDCTYVSEYTPAEHVARRRAEAHDNDEAEEAGDEPLNDNPKDDQCLVCGTTPTDGTDGAGERVCAACGADQQRHGEDITWDDDADQDAELTPALCGYCGQRVTFSIDGDLWEAASPVPWSPGYCPETADHRHDPRRRVTCGYCLRPVNWTPAGLWTLDGTGDRWAVVCGESPGNRHDPDGDPEADGEGDTTEYDLCSRGQAVAGSKRLAHESHCDGTEVTAFQGIDNMPQLPASEASCAYCGAAGPAELFEPVNKAGNLACRAATSCEVRQHGGDVACALGRLLRSVRVELRQLSTRQLAGLAVDVDGWQRDVHLALSGRADSAAQLEAARRDRTARNAGTRTGRRAGTR
jgi:hypothetical protein